MKKYSDILIAVIFVTLPNTAISAEQKSPAPPPVPVKKGPPPGLTGAKLPQCKEGEYIASMLCKISPPDHYLEFGMKYPKPCPEGTSAPAGSKSIAYCK